MLFAALASGAHWFTYPHIDPVAIHLGPISIRWYGLTYLFGALLVYLQLQSARSRARTGMTVDQTQEFVVYAMIGIIIGGRTLYLIADMMTPGGNPPSYYLQHPLEIIAIWHGGMAFHGGLIGAVVGTWFFLRRNKIQFYRLADEASLWTPVAIAMTRCANFINGELPGRLTASPIGMVFPGVAGYRYPSVLFEAAGMLVIVLPLLWLLHGWKGRGDGVVWWAFIAGYGLVRTIVEFYREPGIIWFGLTAAQWLTIGMFVLGIIMWIRCQMHAVDNVVGRAKLGKT